MNLNFAQINTVTGIMSAVLCLILLSQQIYNSNRRADNRWFMLIVFFNLLMVLGDIAQWTLGGNPDKYAYVLINIFTIYIYYAAAGFLMFSVFYWIVIQIKERCEFPKWWFIPTVFFLLCQLLITFTIPLHKAVYVNEENFYTRGSSFSLIMMSTYALYAIVIMILIIYGKAFHKHERVALWILVSAPLAALVIQINFPNFCVQNVIISFALVYVFTFMQHLHDKLFEKQQRELIQLENERLQKLQVYQSTLTEQLISALCGAVEAKDHYTRGHSFRVAKYSKELMRRMGGDDKAQMEAYYIGILHDIGKISMNDDCINKKGRLTPEEYTKMKLHTVEGYQILKNVNVIPDLAIGARWHHERYDGKGYPNGLAGESIPLIARIISVADAYDAMTSNRSYHDAYSQEYVRSEIAKGMGTQFDPEVARIMLEMIDQDVNYQMRQQTIETAHRILVLDDNEEIHHTIGEAMKGDICLFTAAYSYRQAMDYMLSQKYDLCMIDTQLPGLNGFEMLRWIQETSPDTNVVFFNADRNIDTIKEAEAKGVSDYITEPMDQGMIIERIRSYLRKLY